MLNTGPAPLNGGAVSTLSQILEDSPPRKYYLSRTACLGILRRAEERGKELPAQLKSALMAQAGLIPPSPRPGQLKAYHINQRDEGIDLHGVSGALMATSNMQMQTFITGEPVGFDGYNGDLTDKVSATLGTNCGMSTGRNGVIEPIAFAANQRDEVRDLHNVAGAIQAQPGMKQQTFVATGCLNPWDTQQKRVSLPNGVAPTLAGADGGGGRSPGGLLFSAGFCAGAAPTAGSIGYQEEISPTLKAAESGTNMVPSVLCLNDQGGQVMDCSEDVTGTLRAQEHGHQPLVFENHGVDARYKGPLPVAPTITARSGTGGNNLPIVASDRIPDFTTEDDGPCIVFSRQRVDVFKDNDVASTESARQHKDATDLVCQPAYQETVGALTSSDRKGPNNQYVGQDKLVVEGPLLIRRLTPLECERLQGYPDGWTDLPGASDSARYKALGNSVAIPCVEYIMRGIAMAVGQ